MKIIIPTNLKTILLLAGLGLWGCHLSEEHHIPGDYTFKVIGNQASTFNEEHHLGFEAAENQMDVSLNRGNGIKASLELSKITMNDVPVKLDGKTHFQKYDEALIQHKKDFDIEYLNDEKGIRQNFIIKNGDTSDVNFELELKLNTPLQVSKINDFGIVMKDEFSNHQLTYKDLVCYDASGKMINSKMSYQQTDEDQYVVLIKGRGKNISYPLTIDPLVTSSSSFEPSDSSAETGTAVEGACDVNGDGFCDVIVGSPGFVRYGIPNVGKIDIFLGTASGVDLDQSPDYTFMGDTIVKKAGAKGASFGGRFGQALSCGRDINNDGFQDFIVGAPTTTYIDTTMSSSPDTVAAAGAFYVFYGGSTSFNADTFYGDTTSLQLGYALAGLGSINGDLFGDIAVGAPGYDGDRGRVYVYRGSATGIPASPSNIITGTQSNEFFGSAVAGAGDVNGDTRNDILIGAHRYRNGTDTAAGRALLYLGQTGALSATPAWTAVGPHRNALMGFSVAGGGNFNNSGLPDVLIGVKQYNDEFISTMKDTINNYGLGTGNGAVYVFQGTPTALGNTPITILKIKQASGGFGSSVSYAGDVDGDGTDDVLVGAPNYTLSFGGEGAAFAFYGANFQSGMDMTFDWCAFGEKSDAAFGTSVTATTKCNMDGDTSSVVIGARGYESAMGLKSGAAFLYKGTACGLIKYANPEFLSFPPDTIFAVADADTCGTNVSFLYPMIGFNCSGGTVSVVTPIDSGGFFPIGENLVTFRLSADGKTIDSSFIVKVFDTEAPRLTTCPTTISILLQPDQTQGVLTWTDPVFRDNSTCAGQSLTITQVGGPTKGTSMGTGVYPIIYRAVDESGNEAFCTFRVIVRKTGPDGQDCSDQSITSSLVIPKTVSSAASFEYTEKLSDRFSGQRPSLGPDLLISMFESVTGIDIPSWVESAMGQLGTGINLGFVSINLQYQPNLDINYGLFYNVSETTPATATMDYIGQICAQKPADQFYGCRDTISMSSSFIIDPSSSFLRVTPGGLEQTVGVFIKDFSFSWYVGIEVTACIGIPLCLPFIGCLDDSCIGYTDSWSIGTNLFDPINLLGGEGLRLPLITACDEAFMPGAGILTAIECSAGSSGGSSAFVASLVTELGASATPADPFFYDQSNDEFVFEPNRVPLLGNRIPEMSLRFGRLTQNEMNPSYINGTALTVTGQNKNMFSATLDIFSLLYYAIPQNILNGLCASGIQIGTRTINIGIPTVEMNGMCSVKLWNTYFSIDVLDINAIVRSEYNATYTFDPQIKIDSVDLGFPTYWEKPDAMVPVSGISQKIPDVAMDETIRFVVPDGQTDLFFVNNDFSAEGKFTGNDNKTQKVDLGINFIEVIPAARFPVSFGPLLRLGPYNLFTYGSPTPMRTYDETLLINGFSASVAMQPDNMPPVIFTRDTTVYVNDDGFAFLDGETAFDRERSYDLPVGGTGQLNLIDVFPDTITCAEYPSTTAFIVVEDDNCNYDTAAFTVTVIDTLRPRIGCVDIVVGIGADGTYILNPDEIAIGVTDNCANLTVTASPSIFTCEDIGIPQDVTISVVDIAGNTNFCVATVTVVDTLEPEIICPFLLSYPVTRFTMDGLCIYIPDDEEFRPTVVANDCNTQVTYTLTGATLGSGMDNVGGVPFNLGETLVTYTATDESGNQYSCSFIVIVEDNQAPALVCPENVSISTNEDGANDYNCSTSYTWTHPTPVDNCTSISSYTVSYEYADGTTGGADLTDSLSSGNLSETMVLGIGTHTVTYTAVDTMNNVSSCSFTITVIDDELPQIFCNQVTGCQLYTTISPVQIVPNDSSVFVIPVSNNVEITDVNLRLNITTDDLADLEIKLVNPSGLEVVLMDQICPGANLLSVVFDEEAANSVTTACATIQNGDTLRGQEALSAFYGNFSMGDWSLIITSANTAACGTLTDLALEICGMDNTGTDTTRVSILAGEECEYQVLDDSFDPPFTDNCDGSELSHNYIFSPNPNTLTGTVLPLGQTTVIWTVTDSSGNTASCVMIYEVIDQGSPYFINCPEPDVVQEAEPGTCGAYVNFATPIAFDECDGQIVVTQVDDTGLSSGSLFPVGMSIIIFQAEDQSGNTARCIVRVIVNDTQAGLFACPEDVVRSTDNGLYSAIVNGIAPGNVVDNCVDNNSIAYKIEFPEGSGNIIGGGVEDASGNVFPEGVSRVTYRLSSQPILLITEVTQEIQAPVGGMDVLPYTVSTNDDYLEITNLGAADYNISGLLIERFGSGFSDVFEVPNKTILGSGETLVIHYGNGTDDIANHFFNLPCAMDLDGLEPAAYVLAFKGNVIDLATTNGYNAAGLGSIATAGASDWTGTGPEIDGFGGIIRKYSFDNNAQADFVVSENCYPLTIGMLNPDLEAYASNGTTTALQSIKPQISECSFLVTVNDLEAPQCKELVSGNVYQGGPVAGGFDSCNESEILIPGTEDCIIDSIKVNLQGSFSGTDSVFVELISPSGIVVHLIETPCPGNSGDAVSFDITLDDLSAALLSGQCGSASWSGSFNNTGIGDSLQTLYGTTTGGIWRLRVGARGTSDSYVTIDAWSMDIICLSDFSMADVVIENEIGQCGSLFTWTHPYFLDNSSIGNISVTYTTDDADCKPNDAVLVGNGGQMVTEFFCVGTTTVNYTLTDSSGNSELCSFKVTVLDTEAPVLNQANCQDIVINLGSTQCDRSVIFNMDPATIGTDNCGIDSISYSPASGYDFPIGITPVVLTIYDEAGNTDVCTFDVEVIEYLPSADNFACHANVNISLDANCSLVITPGMILTGDDYRCYDSLCVSIIDSLGKPHANLFTLDDQGYTFKVSITDCRAGGNSCWGYVKIEEKLVPGIECPDDVTILCGQSTAPEYTGFALLTSCEPKAEIYHEDRVQTFGQCNAIQSIVTRTWFIDDHEGNIVSCVQRITVAPITLEDIVWPDDIEADMALECTDEISDPMLTHPINTGYPTISDLTLETGNKCLISVIYEDEIYPLCGGSYVLARTWKILNACQPWGPQNPKVHTQAIRVFDTTPPVIRGCPEDVTISTSAWNCYAEEYTLPLPSEITDACGHVYLTPYIYGGGKLKTTGSLGTKNLKIVAQQLAKGPHEIVYLVEDGCGNTASCSFTVTVIDETPPVASAKKLIVVSLTSDEEFGGVAKVFAKDIDNKSYDNCSDVRFEIRRTEGSSCSNEGGTASNGNIHNNNLTYNDFMSGEGYSSLDTDEGAFVKFCCEDATSILVDANEDGRVDEKDRGYHAVLLRVWDDANMDGTIGNTGDLHNDTWTYVKVEDKQRPEIYCTRDTMYCDEELRYSTSNNWVTYNADSSYVDAESVPFIKSNCSLYELEYKDDAYINTCNVGYILRIWRIVGTQISCTQRIDVLQKERTAHLDYPIALHIWNKCTLNEQEVIENTIKAQKKPQYGGNGDGGPNAVLDTLGRPVYFVGTYQDVGCEVFGRDIIIDEFEVGDGCKKWLVRFDYINWCVNESAGSRTTVYKYEDLTPPTVVAVAKDTLHIENGCLASYPIIAKADDEGGCSSAVRWVIKLVGENEEKILAHTGEVINGELVFTNLKPGNYNIYYHVTDGCGNVTSFDAMLVVLDKAPSPYCVSLSSAVMKNGVVELWAKDFDRGSSVNCVPSSLYFTFNNIAPVRSKISEVHYFDKNGLSNETAYLLGTAQKWDPAAKSAAILFGCKVGDGSTYPQAILRMTVWNDHFVANSCEVTLNLIDNQSACGPGNNVVIEGSVLTEKAKALAGVDVYLDAALPEHPRKTTTDQSGLFAFAAVPKSFDYNVYPKVEANDKRGVNTLDLVHIQRHILALKKLDGAYKMVAADVNNDEAIRVDDIVAIRKLILGVYESIPGSPSWKFVDGTKSMGNTPWPFNENITHQSLSQGAKDDFIAVKMGDVDGSIQLGLREMQLSNRNKNIGFEFDDRTVKAGEEIEVEFRANTFEAVYGFQMGLSLNGLTPLECIGQGILIDGSNYALFKDGVMTFSWSDMLPHSITDGSAVFVLKLRATATGKLSSMIGLNDVKLDNEAYVGNQLETIGIQLTSSEQQGSFALFQNQPNPWRGETSIGFSLPEQGKVKFKVTDLSGKLIFSKEWNASRGYNTIQLSRKEIGLANGILIYSLESGPNRLHKKMIIIE